MKKDDTVYLRHIIDAIQRIEKYTKNLNQDQFTANYLVQDGVIRQIEIIGEPAKRVSNQLRNNTSHIPWKDIVGMRNKLIHDYFGVDVDAVWDTVVRDIPGLKQDIQELINK
jgi:uncharacterized protein with HEPN domain